MFPSSMIPSEFQKGYGRDLFRGKCFDSATTSYAGGASPRLAQARPNYLPLTWSTHFLGFASPSQHRQFEEVRIVNAQSATWYAPYS